LFTWGHGGFGKLGHGNDKKQWNPKLVESLQNIDIVHVSCGATHTLAVNNEG